MDAATPPPARVQPLKAYRQADSTRSTSEREAEVLKHLPLVQTVVDRVCAHLPPHVERDDLFHAGVIGLMDALGRFDPSRDNAFSTYAVLRIRGAVIDELRARDWVPRGARERARQYREAVNQLSSELGRLPDDRELADRLGVGEADLPDIERQAHLAAQVSFDAPVGEEETLGSGLSRPSVEDNPARHLERDDQRRMLVQVLGTISEQERLVLKLYYFENLLMKEIAAVMGVTESRICQIHGRVLALLRSRLGRDLF